MICPDRMVAEAGHDVNPIHCWHRARRTCAGFCWCGRGAFSSDCAARCLHRLTGLQSTKEYCITVNHQALCPGEERKLGNDFAIDAGFAPNSKYWPKLKPKWHYHFRFGEFNRLDHEAAVAQAGTTEEFIAYLWMAKDYCIYRNKPYLLWEWPECRLPIPLPSRNVFVQKGDG